MKIAVLGSGMVGNAVATKLVQAGHQVLMGSRTAKSDGGQKWLQSVAGKAQIGTFADAAAFGEMIFNCTNGANSLEALRQAGQANMRGKTLVDTANPLDVSQKPPTLTICNTSSLAEQIQSEFPQTRVVKALNTVNIAVMVNPQAVTGDHNLFVCGNEAKDKTKVVDLIAKDFGWKRENIIDLGDITAARGMEMYMPIWLRLWSALGTLRFNVHIVRES